MTCPVSVDWIRTFLCDPGDELSFAAAELSCEEAGKGVMDDVGMDVPGSQIFYNIQSDCDKQ